jgi:hypothetical protein
LIAICAENRAACRAAVLDVDELHTGQTQPFDHGIRVARRIAAAVGELHVRPRQAGIRKRLAHGKDALFDARNAVRATEAVDADTDDEHVAHLPTPAGWKA